MLPCGVYNERYGQDMAIVRTKRHWAALLGALFLLYLFPVFDLQYFISLINYLCITIIIVLGLQIVTGFCGQISFGQAAFMAVGAYTSGILTLTYGWPFWLALPVSGLVAGLVGLVGGAPSLRIKGFYLAMATLAIHFLIMWLIMHWGSPGPLRASIPHPPASGHSSLTATGGCITSS